MLKHPSLDVYKRFRVHRVPQYLRQVNRTSVQVAQLAKANGSDIDENKLYAELW